MRFLVSVFLLLGVIGYANADATYNTAEAEQVVASVSDMGDELRADYDALIEKVRAINPKIVDEIEKKAKSDEAKISMLRSYLARETFEYYKNKFMSDLKQRSRETGRKIRHEDFETQENKVKNTQTYYWLDRGDLDEKKCRKDGWQICPYPDGFEDFSLTIEETNQVNSKKEKRSGNASDMYSIRFHKDVPSENYYLACTINLDYASEAFNAYEVDDFYENSTLRVFCSTELYSEHHAWRNQEVADIVAGKYDIVSVEKLPEGSPFGKVVYGTRFNENPTAWKSSVLPSSSASTAIFDYSSSKRLD